MDGFYQLNSSNNGIKGSLEERNFATILSDLYLEKSSGYLDVRSDMEMGIYFFNGIVKYVDCNDPNLLIGKLLVSNEIITKEQQREIIDFSNKKGIQIGEALIEQGWLTPHELSRILEFQMKLKLLNGFRFKSGDYSFTETDKITPNSDIIFNINPIQVTYDAVDSNIFLDSYDLSQNEKAGTIYPSLFFNKINDIGMSSNQHHKLVGMLRSPIPVEEVISKSPMDKQKTLKFIKFTKLVQFVRIVVSNECGLYEY